MGAAALCHTSACARRFKECRKSLPASTSARLPACQRGRPPQKRHVRPASHAAKHVRYAKVLRRCAAPRTITSATREVECSRVFSRQVGREGAVAGDGATARWR